jgi:hypothetical protein
MSRNGTNAVEYVRGLLGPNAVLLACPRNQKGPRSEGWNKRTRADMDDPHYLSSLNHGGGIAVLLGKPSDGLCTIDIDSDAAMEEFLELNPKLQGALRTRRVRGCNIWVRPTGTVPASAKLQRAGGG